MRFAAGALPVTLPLTPAAGPVGLAGADGLETAFVAGLAGGVFATDLAGGTFVTTAGLGADLAALADFAGAGRGDLDLPDFGADFFATGEIPANVVRLAHLP